MKINKNLFVSRLLAVLTAFLVCLSLTARANVFNVTNLFDSGAGSLRDAITQAESSAGSDTINFGVGGTINFGSILPTITSDISISSNGFGVTFDGTSAGDRAFLQTGGTLSLSGLTIQNFTATNVTTSSTSGGAIRVEGGDLNISGSTFIGNSGLTGGAIRLQGGGTGTINSSTFTGNSSLQGGAITTSSANLNLIGSQVTNNTSINTGNLATGIGGGLSLSGGVVSIDNSDISDNVGERAGGGLRINGATVTITNSSINSNEAQTLDEDGGGLIVFGEADVTISDSEINENTSNGSAGGLQMQNVDTEVTLERTTVDGNEARTGGGIAIDGGELTITQTTISNNEATDTTGGGIQGVRATDITIENSTISGNTSSGGGGGIALGEEVSGEITSSTIAFNNSGGGGAGLRFSQGADNTFEVENSIFSDNLNSGTPDNISGPVESLGYNLFDDDGGGIVASIGDQFNAFADLDALAANGGPTFTHALGVFSEAIDAGSTNLPTDQRGFFRPGGSADDIGAYEFGAVPELSATSLFVGIAALLVVTRRRRRYR